VSGNWYEKSALDAVTDRHVYDMAAAAGMPLVDTEREPLQVAAALDTGMPVYSHVDRAALLGNRKLSNIVEDLLNDAGHQPVYRDPPRTDWNALS
jgi:hypothetical protein